MPSVQSLFKSNAIQGVCTTILCNERVSCGVDSGGNTRFCSDGSCVQCVDNQQCGANQICDTYKKVCVQCTQKSDCPSGFTCNQTGECEATCTQKSDCAESKFCSTGKKCVDCLADTDCANGLVCQNGVCGKVTIVEPVAVSSLSTAAIVGIVVGVVFLLVMAMWFLRKKLAVLWQKLL